MKLSFLSTLCICLSLTAPISGASPLLQGVPSNTTVECGQVPQAATVTATSVCQPTNGVLNPANGHYYQLVHADLSWSQAVVMARISWGPVTGHLVTISSSQENAFIIGLLPTNAKAMTLGAYEDSTGAWHWVTGEPFSYANWYPGDPTAGIENYLYMHGPFFPWVGTWGDGLNAATSDPETYYHVVEWDAEGTGGGVVPVTLHEAVQGGCPGTVTRTWTATDGCGVTTSATQVITVNATPPQTNGTLQLVGVPSDATVECGQVPAAAVVTAIGDCTPTNRTLNEENGHYYQVVNSHLSWSQAVAMAQVAWGSITGHLVTITSSQENSFVVSLLTTNVKALTLGGYEDATGQWHWVSGETFSYSNWYPGEPTAGSEKYLYMLGPFFPFGGVWTDGNNPASSDPATDYHVIEWDGAGATNGGISVTLQENVSGGCPGTVTRTWVATDSCGNSTSATQVITVNAAAQTNIPLQLIGVPADVTVPCGQVPAAAVVTTTGGCDMGVSSSGLILYYPFNSAEGSTVEDQSGHGNGGTVAAGISYVSTGQVGGAYRFTGAGSIAIPGLTEVNGAAELSWGAWIRPNPTVNTLSVMGNTMAFDESVQLVVGRDLRIINGGVDREGDYAFLDIFDVLDLNAWQHVMGTYDGHQVKLYKNGSLIGQTTNYADAKVISSNNVTFAVGDIAVGRGWLFHGLIDEVTIFDRALSAAEVNAMYTSGINGSSSIVTVCMSESVQGGCPGTVTRTWTATDACGNTTSATQVITVTAAPQTNAPLQLIGVPSNVVLTCGQEVPAAAEVTATGYCAPTNRNLNSVNGHYYQVVNAQLSWSQAFTMAQIPWGTVTGHLVTITSSQENAFVVGLFSTNVKALTLGGFEDATGQWHWVTGEPFAYTNWYPGDPTPGSEKYLNMHGPFFPWAGTWMDGNLPATGDPATYFHVIEWDSEGETNGGISVTLQENVVGGCPGTVTRTWTATDGCGNTTSATQVITMQGISYTNVPLALIGVPSNTTVECGEVPDVANVSATGYCTPSNRVFLPHSGNFYQLVNAHLTWSQAVAMAQIPWGAVTGHLVTISSSQEHAFVLGLLPTNATAMTLGGYEDATGQWHWVTGEPFSYTYWAPGQPNPAGEFYLYMNGPFFADAGVWHDGDNPPTSDPKQDYHVVEWEAADPNNGSASVTFQETIQGGCPGTVTRTWTATDDCGNSTSATQVITVNAAPQTNPPVQLVGVPAGITVACGQVPAAASVTATGGCLPTNAVLNPDNGHYYRVVNAQLNWSQAVAMAKISLGTATGHLVTITSSQENAFVVGLFSTNVKALTLGGYEDATGQWHWVTGEPFAYTNWYPGDPNPGSEKYLNMHGPFFGGFAGTWMDGNLAPTADPATYFHVIEWDTVGAAIVTLQETVQGGCPGTVTRTWTATDSCGNSTSATQVITVLAREPRDTDGDGLDDSVETGTGIYVSPENTGTDPTKFDTDGDGMGDGYEVTHGTNPNVRDFIRKAVRNDFDGDRKSDVAVYDPIQTGAWVIRSSATGQDVLFDVGLKHNVPATGDYDGDGKVDVAMYDPNKGKWYLVKSTEGYAEVSFGYDRAAAVPGDYDGDGRTDIAVFDADAGMWYMLLSQRGFTNVQFGFSGCTGLTGDFDNDGRDDICVFYNQYAQWYVLRSTAGFASFQFGFGGTLPVVGDFDGDGYADAGVYNPKRGRWYLGETSAGLQSFIFGFRGTVPLVGDYDGDGLSDVGIYLGGKSARWYLLQSGAGYMAFPFGNDKTVPIGTMP